MVRFETPYNKRERPPHHGGESGAPHGETDTLQGKASAPQSTEGVASGSRSWNSWWARRSPGIVANDSEPVRIGVDAGSKTIKLVALDARDKVVFAIYHRHRSDVLSTFAEVLHEAIWRYGDLELPMAMTGSAGIALAAAIGVPFVQEVVATTAAVRAHYPHADCIVELGGEDAKITYLTGGLEQRMNATCAGGTGDFIDGIASMLGIRTRDMSHVAMGSQRTYPIASRCAVFAQTDVRPLVSAGASKADIAQSALDAVVDQTLGGLACGRPIRGTVVFLGGPLEHIPALVLSFRRKLGLDAKTGIKPPDAHLFTAAGAVLVAEDAPAVALSELERRVRSHGSLVDDATHLPPLFSGPGEIREFRERHAREHVARARIDECEGPLFLGLDAGSTSVKYVLADREGAIVASDYVDVEGDTFQAAKNMVESALMAAGAAKGGSDQGRIARAVVTGYGEELLKAGLGFDSGVVETVAHLRAARHFKPDVSFVLDIGGQDMKALWVRDGRVVDAVLNEACSSGCGAFVKSSAKSLGLADEAFSSAALSAQAPIDLGAKCTVFMTSRVRHAQKAGAAAGDIAAGVAYSIANNVLTRIIGKNHALPLGDSVVVQGGTFKSDAVLRAFEKALGVQAVRPSEAHLMGALGAALVAKDEYEQPTVRPGVSQGAAAHPERPAQSGLIALPDLQKLQATRTSARCPGCGNACLVSIVDFGGGHRFVSGNRCDRAHEALFGERLAQTARVPNVVALEQKLVSSFGDAEGAGPRAQVHVGLLDVLHAYENMPFWHTLLRTLGFTVLVAGRAAERDVRSRAAETVPSESVCHPAKVAHVRYFDLAQRGADVVFAPTYERGTRCPVACQYPLALADNVDGPPLSMPRLRAIRPAALAANPQDAAAVLSAVNGWLRESGSAAVGGTMAVGEGEFARAIEAALQAQRSFDDTLARATDKVFSWLADDRSRRAAVIAGRPYHADPALLHGIDAELTRLGFAVVPMAGLSARLGEARHANHGSALWKPAKHVCNLVELTAEDDQLEIVGVRSFGCGYDAVSFDEAHDLAHELGRPFTELKIDDIADTAHIRIRLQTLAYASRAAERASERAPAAGARGGGDAPCPHQAPAPHRALPPTPDLCSTAKAVVQRAVKQVEGGDAADPVVVPRTCLDCLTDALPFELSHILGVHPPVEERSLAMPQPLAEHAKAADRPKVGLLGNPLLVFDAELNDGAAELVEHLGWQPVLPDPALVEVEDVRYLDQLQRFREQGVQRVIYLQSFGCLKGHVQSRGALHDLARRFPDLPITVIDYDPESSALNRENRIRLALAK